MQKALTETHRVFAILQAVDNSTNENHSGRLSSQPVKSEDSDDVQSTGSNKERFFDASHSNSTVSLQQSMCHVLRQLPESTVFCQTTKLSTVSQMKMKSCTSNAS